MNTLGGSVRPGPIGGKGGTAGLTDNSTVMGPGIVSVNSGPAYGRQIYSSSQGKTVIKFGTGSMAMDTIGAPVHDPDSFQGPLPIHKTPNNDQGYYTEGTILLILKGSTETLGSRESTVAAIQNFNAKSEQRARFHQKNKLLGPTELSGGSVELSATDKKRMRHVSPSSDIYPLTQEDFQRDWCFLGVVKGSDTKTGFVDKSTNKRMLNIRYYGEFKNLPNMWGVNVAGKEVGLIVKEDIGQYTSYLDLDGKTIGEPTTVPFIQILPCIPKDDNRFPPNSSEFMNPQSGDKDYWRTITTQQIVLPTKDNGLVDRSGEKPSTPIIPMTHNDYKEGIYIRFGVVTRTHTPQFTDAFKKAPRSFRHYEQLRGESAVDVYIFAHPEIPLPSI